MSGYEADEAARNLTGFVRLLVEIDRTDMQRGDANAGNQADIVFVKPKDGLIAFASVVLDDQLYLGGIAIHSKLDGSGYRLTYPTRKVGETQFNLFHPIRKSLGCSIEYAIIEKLKNVVRKRNVGHDRIDAGPIGI